MTYTFKLARRIARLRAPAVLAAVLLSACGSHDSLGPDGGSNLPESPALASTSFAGGIPFGTFDQPNTQFNQRYNGAVRIIWPEYLIDNLSEIRSRGGRVILDLAGSQDLFKDADGHFSMTKWKARIDRYKTVNFTSFINDGTIIAHYIIDEPNDPTNWNGEIVSQATVEAMAQYSKQLWPGMATVIRTEPRWADDWTGTYRYLDAAWAQYVSWKGTPEDFLRANVTAAQNKGLQLVVGLNISKGGPNLAPMTASQVENWGSAMLNSSYPCAFMSWHYDATYLSSNGMPAAMDLLRSKAQNRATRSCLRGGADSDPVPPPPSDTTSPPDTTTPPPPPSVSGSLPFGLYQPPLDQYSTRWSSALLRADPSSLLNGLSRAQSNGMKVMVMLVGPNEARNTDGTFNLTKWKAAVDRYRTLSVGGYITDRTFYTHHLVDQPGCTSCWGGKAIPWQTVEEMARYSKTIWPAVPTSVRADPSQLAGATFAWSYLDAAWIVYHTGRGDLRTYLSREVTAAGRERLGLIAGLNLMDGAGSGTSSMTATQVQQFGTVLAAEPAVCGLVNWKYDAAYISRSDIGAALDAVATTARSRAPGSCVVN